MARAIPISGRYGFFKVIDDGPGIEGTILNKIFYPFLRRKRWNLEQASGCLWLRVS
jgi:signal transduction histidine kinase